jgi:CHASE2 domain-containing sensor protein
MTLSTIRNFLAGLVATCYLVGILGKLLTPLVPLFIGLLIVTIILQLAFRRH